MICTETSYPTETSYAVRRLPGASLLIAASAVCVSLTSPLAEWLQYDRTAVAAGQFWRFITCHLAHWSFDHLLWDGMALVALGVLCEVEQRRTFLWCVGISALLIPVSLWICVPNLDFYRGLSGIDSAIFMLLATTVLRENTAARRWGGVIVAGFVTAGFLGKTGFELLTGDTLFVDSAAAGMVPLPLVHVVGALVGLICGLFSQIHAAPQCSEKNSVNRESGRPYTELLPLAVESFDRPGTASPAETMVRCQTAVPIWGE